jgi:hypothetical protein
VLVIYTIVRHIYVSVIYTIVRHIYVSVTYTIDRHIYVSERGCSHIFYVRYFHIENVRREFHSYLKYLSLFICLEFCAYPYYVLDSFRQFRTVSDSRFVVASLEDIPHIRTPVSPHTSGKNGGVGKQTTK